jgi:hypothetical protein
MLKKLLLLILLSLVLTGCAYSIPRENSSQTPHLSATSTETPEPSNLSQQEPRVVTVRPPMIPIGPIQGTPGLPVPTLGPLPGWQTFSSTALGVAVDYPMDWSISENDAGATFTSQQNITILLKMDKSLTTSSQTGQDCTTLINSYGQSGDLCFEAATFTYRAIFKKPSDASVGWLSLSIISQEKPTVFLQMFDSLRPVP